MAEGVVFDVAKTLLELLGSPVFNEIQLARGVKDEIEKLKRMVETVQAVLVDAEEQHSRKNEVVTVWIRRLKDAFYEADDLLHDYASQLEQRRMMTGNEMTKKVRIFFSRSNQIVCSFKMAHQIKAVREKLEEIKNDKQFHLTERRDEKPTENRERNQTYSFVPKEKIIGREDDKKAIISRLLDSKYDENVSIIPIVGMGGLGKTTLVQLVYDDEDVKQFFSLRMWVCAYEKEFNVKTIVKKILKSITENEPENVDMDQLQRILLKNIDGKRYLLVLDDVWNENLYQWEKLKDLLMNSARGSKILVTTRNKQVANITNKNFSYDLKGLSNSDSWSLFKQIVFEREIKQKYFKLEAIGKEIIAKCVGVPLAIKTIGFLLYTKYKEDDWSYFKDNEMSNIPQNEDDILPILQLSYDHLPAHLKQCFAYCALFSKDYKIEKRRLIYLWRAQGFLQSNNNECSEDVGNNYFEDLLLRSFFQEPTYDEGGNVITCKMHSLMHDLAQSVAGFECTIKTKDAKTIERCRHLSLYDSLEPCNFLDVLCREKHMRTFLLLHPRGSFYYDSWSKLSFSRHLRSLDFGTMGKYRELPDSIGKLRYLRYLNISYSQEIEKLPQSILRLRNLETLDLTGCKNLKELPTNIKKLVNLKDLIIERCESLIGMPFDLGLLTNLQTLSLFVIQRRNKKVHKKYAGLEELNGFNNLRGKLKIKNLEQHMDKGKLASLVEKKKLIEFLELEWVCPSDGREVERSHKEVLEDLKPHNKLKGISIKSCMSWKISGCLSSLQYLNSIEIERCRRLQHIPPLEELPFLKSLSLFGLDELEYISGKESNNCSSIPTKPFFPSLKKLNLYSCLKLEGWWKREDDDDGPTTQIVDLPSFPCLSQLKIKFCPKLTSMPLFPYLEELECIATSYKPVEQTAMLKTNAITMDPSASSNSSGPLSNLKSIFIRMVDDLESIPEECMRNLTSLVRMGIDECPKLSQMSQGLRYLTSLQNLSLWGCSELELINNEDDDDVQWKGLRDLSRLKLISLPKLKSLPKELQYATSMQYLDIRDCCNLVALPDWISNSTSLSRLYISRCPQLSKRYGNEDAVDWEKISHIPNIIIDDKWIQKQGCYLENAETFLPSFSFW